MVTKNRGPQDGMTRLLAVWGALAILGGTANSDTPSNNSQK
jgi:hypothetical protein